MESTFQNVSSIRYSQKPVPQHIHYLKALKRALLRIRACSATYPETHAPTINAPLVGRLQEEEEEEEEEEKEEQEEEEEEEEEEVYAKAAREDMPPR